MQAPSVDSAKPDAPPVILLTTLNARFIHASLGLRYLLANMGNLRPYTGLREFNVATPVGKVVDEILRTLSGLPGSSTVIIGFGVYIWNVCATTEVVRRLKAMRPTITIVLGGPEVSHETASQEIVKLADHVITGWGDVSFARLCRALLHGPTPLTKIIAGEQPPLARIAWPYAEYTDADLAHRLLYVEASRGCPFKCEFCLSALDKTACTFDLDCFLAQMDALYQRGARHFKFVDRTFNLKIDASIRILQFFLDRLPDASHGALAKPLFLHFEVIPDHLPDRLKEIIVRFPPGVLQLEVGIQSFNREVQQRISRQQDNERSEANLRWLVTESNAHVHADLVFGLPGETLESFAHGFDRLYALQPHEIQLGLLKRLRGTPIVRHSAEFGMVYDAAPPYALLHNSAVDIATVQRFVRCARYWEQVANSGRFLRTLALLLRGRNGANALANSPFCAFLHFSDWLWQRSDQTSRLSPEMLVDALFDYLATDVGDPGEHRINHPVRTVRAALLADYVGSGARGSPSSLKGVLPRRAISGGSANSLQQRQERHLAARQPPD